MSGISGTVTMESTREGGFFMGGSCTVASPAGGIVVGGGMQEHGPLGYYEIGHATGIKGGCSAPAGIGW